MSKQKKQLMQEFTVSEQQILQKYHTYFVQILIDAGVVTEPNQISVLQNSLNTYLHEQQAGGK